jgi:hypothetical protein
MPNAAKQVVEAPIALAPSQKRFASSCVHWRLIQRDSCKGLEIKFLDAGILCVNFILPFWVFWRYVR